MCAPTPAAGRGRRASPRLRGCGSPPPTTARPLPAPHPTRRRTASSSAASRPAPAPASSQSALSGDVVCPANPSCMRMSCTGCPPGHGLTVLRTHRMSHANQRRMHASLNWLLHHTAPAHALALRAACAGPAAQCTGACVVACYAAQVRQEHVHAVLDYSLVQLFMVECNSPVYKGLHTLHPSCCGAGRQWPQSRADSRRSVDSE